MPPPVKKKTIIVPAIEPGMPIGQPSDDAGARPPAEPSVPRFASEPNGASGVVEQDVDAVPSTSQAVEPVTPQDRKALVSLQNKIKRYQKRFPQHCRELDKDEVAHALSRDATIEDAEAVLEEIKMASSNFDGSIGRSVYFAGVGAVEGIVGPALGYDLKGLSAALATNKMLMDKIDEMTIEMTAGISYIPPHVFIALSTVQAIIMVGAANSTAKAAAAAQLTGSASVAPQVEVKPLKPNDAAPIVAQTVAEAGAAAMAPIPVANMGSDSNDALPPGLRREASG